MEILSASDKEQVKRYSSINQFNSMLHVTEKGEAIPIVSDWLDEIDCNGHIKSHKVMINLRSGLVTIFQLKNALIKILNIL